MNVFVYGLVAGIVKLDDAGIALVDRIEQANDHLVVLASLDRDLRLSLTGIGAEFREVRGLQTQGLRAQGYHTQSLQRKLTPFDTVWHHLARTV